MESELIFTDEMIFEDFQVAIREIPRKPKSEFDSNDYYRNNKPNYSSNNTIKPTEINSKITSCSNVCLSTYIDNLEQSVFTDTMSLNSEFNEESCSGSSLQRYDSPHESELCDDSGVRDTTVDRGVTDRTDNTFTMKTSDVFSDETLHNLKAAIQVKWLDRTICVRKTMHQKDKIHLEKIDLKSKFRFYAKHFLSTELLDTVQKSRCKHPQEEIPYNIDSIEFYNYVPKVTEIKKENCLVLCQPNVFLSTKIITDRKSVIDRKDEFIELEFTKAKNFSKRSKSLSDIRKPNIQANEKELRNCDTNSTILLQSRNVKLQNQVVSQNKFIEELKSNYINMKVQLNKANSNLQMAYETIQKLKSNAILLNNSIERLRYENSEIRKANEHFKIVKENTEKFLINEQQNKELLEKKIESYSAIENDYQWLYKAFIDYRNLCQDYDNLHTTYMEMESQLAKASHSYEESTYQIKYLENEISKYKQQIDNASQIKQTHAHENGCNCRPHDCGHCYHQKFNHSNSKAKKKSRKPSHFTYERGDDFEEIPKTVEQKNPADFEHNRTNSTEKKLNIKEVEKLYDELQIRKRKLESELCHVPLNGSSSRRGGSMANMGEKESIENELDKVDHELSSIRRTLKQFKVIGDR